MDVKGKKEKKSVVFKKHLKIIIIVSLFLSFVFVGIYFSLLQKDICGDGTSYGECSERKPYFCEQGILIEKASVCGCFESLEIDGDSCFSEYQTGIKNITLSYILRGENKIINFEVYNGLAEYLLKLPRSIRHINNETPSKLDFKLRNLDEEEQRYLLLPLVTKIQNSADSKKDQVRIAVSLVQKIPFGSSEKFTKIGNNKLSHTRYPYEVLYDWQGVCSEKSELLAFILREMGYGVAFFYYPSEDHEVVAIKCPRIQSVAKSGYCFIETTGPAIITDDHADYDEIGKLSSEPELIIVSEGKSLGYLWYEYWDARKLRRIRMGIGIFKEKGLENLRAKYGLSDVYNI